MAQTQTERLLMWTGVGLGIGLLLRALRTGGALTVVDLTDRANLTDKARKHTRKRDPSKVYAATLHQMGFSRGNDPNRYLRVTAHFIILPDGGVYQLHPISTRLPQANGFNSGSVGIEFAGNFPSVPGSSDASHYWFPQGKRGDPRYMNQVTPAQVRAGRQLLRKLQADDGFTHVLAHRQSSGTRGNDPGPDIWRSVGQWAVSNLGLSDGGPGFAVGNGQPIRDDWRGSPTVA